MVIRPNMAIFGLSRYERLADGQEDPGNAPSAHQLHCREAPMALYSSPASKWQQGVGVSNREEFATALNPASSE